MAAMERKVMNNVLFFMIIIFGRLRLILRLPMGSGYAAAAFFTMGYNPNVRPAPLRHGYSHQVARAILKGDLPCLGARFRGRMASSISGISHPIFPSMISSNAMSAAPMFSVLANNGREIEPPTELS